MAGIVLRKQDAGMIGYWGEFTGDVIFSYNQGFVWGTNHHDTVSEVSVPGANHGPQIPTACTDYSSNFGIALWHGSKVRRGYRRDRHVQGAYAMNDIGFTISRLFNVNDLDSLYGKFMHDLFI
ncbi:hypothetical protein [Alicyclobacillus fodiniaquatilis]|uniref:hypothetical protein n=1 Tax=Alicyclobacillus fodiniaquatilis TaxID=1661150 RepID=UPI00366FBD0F